jgi:hypothetical protein
MSLSSHSTSATARGGISGRSAPVQMHIDGQCGRRYPVGQMALFTSQLVERKAEPPEPFRQRRLEVTGVDEFGEKGVLRVVAGDSCVEPAVVVVGEEAAAETGCQRAGSADDARPRYRCADGGARGRFGRIGDSHSIDDADVAHEYQASRRADPRRGVAGGEALIGRRGMGRRNCSWQVRPDSGQRGAAMGVSGADIGWRSGKCGTCIAAPETLRRRCGLGPP